MTPELFITRHNELVDPFVQVWSWQIPVYLFLGGLVAGMMIITGFSLVKGRYGERSCICSALPGVGLVMLSLGMLALFLDLEHKWYVWRLYTTFQPSSPMSWGAWILVLVYPVLIASWLVRPPALLEDLSQTVERASAWLQARPQAVRAMGAASLGLGVALGIYTGILLSSLGARPLWSSGILGPLFLASGLSAAAAFTHMVARNEHERIEMARLDNVALTAELGILALLMLGLFSGSAPQMAAAGLFMGGAYTAPFWVFVVALGIVMPLIIQNLAVAHRIAHTPLAPLMVMTGSLALRFVFVQAGQMSHWAHGVLGVIRH
ncbi:MAG: polysulfide reductase NrfD [Acidobacteria bacterium]|nr:polysulfide reductase NrfD [Acidobacteriota bacterium]